MNILVEAHSNMKQYIPIVVFDVNYSLCALILSKEDIAVLFIELVLFVSILLRALSPKCELFT